MAEKGAGQVTETLLVIDATTGQNGLIQAKEFNDATDVTGVVLTKLDGSAKGGIVCSRSRPTWASRSSSSASARPSAT